jgi:hypothetical protein
MQDVFQRIREDPSRPAAFDRELTIDVDVAGRSENDRARFPGSAITQVAHRSGIRRQY